MTSSRGSACGLPARVLALAVTLCVVATAVVAPAWTLPASAAESITVRVRVEGISSTHADRTVHLPEGAKALDAVVEALNDSGKTCQVRDLGWGEYLSSVESDAEGAFGGWDGWMYAVIRGGAIDPASATTGAGAYTLSDLDTVLFYYGGVVWPTPVAELRREDSEVLGKVAVRLVDLNTGDGIKGATVRLGVTSAVTDAAGRAFLDLGDDGEQAITAEKTDPASTPPGAPLIARPEPFMLWVEDGDGYRLGVDSPTIDSTSYDGRTCTLSVTGAVYAGAEAVGRVLDAGTVVGEVYSPGPSGRYALTFPSITGGTYDVSVFARLADGARSRPVTRAVSVLPDTVLSDSLLSEKTGLAKGYLKSQQQDDGNLGSWPAIELAGAGEDLLSPDYVKNGLSHLDYLTSRLGEPGYLSRTTDYARSILEVLALGADPSDIAGQDLISAIQSRQAPGGHFGGAGEETWVNSHAWSIIALRKAGRPVPDASLARQWLLNARNPDNGWGFATGVSSSPDMTAQAIRELLALGEPAGSHVIADAIAFLATKQAGTGGIFDDSFGPTQDANVYSTAEVVKALCEAGVNPLSSPWLKSGKNMMSYLVGCQGANGQVKSVKGTADFLGAVAAFSSAGFSVAGSDAGSDPGDDGNNGGEQPQEITVTVEVRGKDGKAMRSRRAVDLDPSDPTPLAALQATGADVVVRDGGYVAAIDGLSQSGASGWKYAVNGVVPSAGCAEYELDDGDSVVWFWAKDYRDTGGFQDTIAGENLPPLPLKPELSPDQVRQREALRQAAVRRLEEIRDGSSGDPGAFLETSPGCEVLAIPGAGADDTAAMTRDEMAYWKAALERNVVGETDEVAPGAAVTIGDETGEFEIAFPANAFGGRQVVSIVEGGPVDAGDYTLPRSHLGVTPVYSVTAGEMLLAAPVNVSIRVVPPGDDRPGDLIMARYDASTQRWIPLPSVYDPANGQITASSTALGSFAVFKRTSPVVSFADVSGRYGWAEESVKMLATAGYVDGVTPSSFEPGRDVTRAEFVKMLLLVMGIQPLDGRAAPFVDVSGNEWHAGYLSAAASAGLVMGLPDGLFRPDDPINRQEVAVLLARSAGNTRPGSGLSRFKDADSIPVWARDAISTVAGLGIAVGAPDGTFRPGAATTRAEAAVMLARFLLVPGRR
ncbi:MAG: S-layer homology domain-containing protein [Ignavibacteriales bacterium]